MIWGNTERGSDSWQAGSMTWRKDTKNNLRNHTFMENILEERP